MICFQCYCAAILCFAIMFSYILCIKVLHHNYVFISTVPLPSGNLSFKRSVDLYKVHKYKSIAHRIKPVDGGITMKTPLTSRVDCALGPKQLERKTCLYSHNKQTLSV